MTEVFDLPDIGPAETRGTAQAKNRFMACAASGLLRYAVPDKVGGHGNTFADLIDIHARLGEQTRDPGLLLAVNAHVWGSVFPLLKFGTQVQKDKWIPKLLDGELIGGHAITEPQAGSDIQGMETTATETPDGYVLNGHKRYITNTPLAGMLIIYAKLAGSSSISAFIVKADDEGADFRRGPATKGCSTAAMGDVVLTECQVPADRGLGKAGAGSTMIQLALELERAFIFAGIAGVMQWQLQQVIQYVRSRRSGKGALGDVQVVAHKIADMKLRLETTRLWIRQCADLCDAGKRITLASAQTKLYASEAFLQSSLDASHLLGALGQEHEFADWVQDAMAGRLLSGSSEIQKNIIAAMLGLGGR